jgi:HAD superfamily hydrolase (TIGR01490 family)
MSEGRRLWRTSQTRATISVAHMEAAFFDLDKTIIARSGSLALSRSFMREGLIARSTLLKSMYAGLVFQLMGADDKKMERIRAEAARLTAGWEVAKVRSVVAEVLEEVITPLIYAEALELMHDHRGAGRLICIVSSTPEEIVEPLARMLQVDRWIATRPMIVEGKYSGELDFYAYGPYKVQAINALAEELDIDLDHSFAYSDSITDLPMLESVGHPVAVNPDRELRRIAVGRRWPVELFRNPVPIRSRIPRFTRPDATVANGLAAAAAVVCLVAVAWWLAKRNTERVE